MPHPCTQAQRAGTPALSLFVTLVYEASLLGTGSEDRDAESTRRHGSQEHR